jgi:flagellar biosynthesis protein FlhB
MAEQDDKESKTEEATEKKLLDEVGRGNVPFSREAAHFASIAAMLIIVAFLLRDLAGATTASLQRLLSVSSGWPLRNGFDAVALFAFVGWEIFRLLIPALILLAASGLVSSFAQNPPRIVLDRIQPDLKRISITNGWHRVFGARGRAEFLKGAFKLISISVAVWAVLQSQRDKLVNAMVVDPEAIPELILSIAMRLLSVVCLVTLLLFAADFLWTRLNWRKELRMSKQEINEERKQNEGDPLMKARLRSLALDRRRKSMIAAVPRATLVIANPTHFAIALRYVKEEGGAPLVLSKGKDLIALKIREVAEQHSIPIVEDKLLARSMYDSAEIGRTIPPEFYKAVAELIHVLYNKEVRKAAVT